MRDLRVGGIVEIRAMKEKLLDFNPSEAHQLYFSSLFVCKYYFFTLFAVSQRETLSCLPLVLQWFSQVLV